MDSGMIDMNGRWIHRVTGEDLGEPPWPIGSRVRVRSDIDVQGGPFPHAGTVRKLAWADDYTFRVEFDDGAWGKFTSWELEKAHI